MRLPPIFLVFLAACTQTDSISSPTGSIGTNAGNPDAIALPPEQLIPQPPLTAKPPVAKPSVAQPSVTKSSAEPQSDQATASAIAPAKAASRQPAPAIASATPALAPPSFQTTARMAGFSTDGGHFIYLESSRDTGAGIPKSRLQVINVSTNRCAANGCLETQFREADAAKQLADAEQSLLQQTWQIRQDLKLTPPATGTPVPIVSRSRTANGTETITARLNNRDLQLQLSQKRVISTIHGGTAERAQAAMQIVVSYNGQTRSLGSLNDYRDWVLDYSIRELRLSPDGQHLAILLTATRPTFEGTLGTTIVQGLAL